MNLYIKCFSCAFLVLTSAYVFAEDKIKVTVKTNEKKVFAIGFTLDAQEFGGLGNYYTTNVPKDRTYNFGYRKDSLFGEDVKCGSLTLTQDSNVILINKDNICTSIID